MKKILSLLLVVCLLVTGSALFSSCSSSKVSEKDLQNDPQAVLGEAMQNMGNNFFSDDAETEKVMEKALKKGMINISFESETLLGAITKISETLYMDSENAQYVSDTAVTMSGEELAARIFLNKDGLALNGESVLGSNKTLAVNLATLVEKFETSGLATLLGLDDATSAEVVDTIEMIKSEYEKALTSKEEDTAKLANDLLKALNMAVATEDVTLGDADVKCVVATYTLTNATVKALADKLVAEMGLEGEAKTEAETAINDAIEQLNATADINMTVKVAINQKANEVAKVEVNGTVAPKEEGIDATTVAAAITFAETEIKLTCDVTEGEDTASVEIKLTKEDANGTTTYKLAVNATQDDVTLNMLNASYAYTKSTGAIVLAADLYNGEDVDRTAVELTGKLTVSETEVKLEFTSLKMGDITLTFKASISAKAVDSIPTVPSDAQDVMDIDTAGWMEIMTEFQTSKVGSLVFGMMQ